MAVYQYLFNDEPMTRCPECDADLTVEDSINLELCVAGHPIETKSRLRQNGILQDTEDKAVSKGFHSGTSCGKCGETLLSIDGVDEFDVQPNEEEADESTVRETFPVVNDIPLRLSFSPTAIREHFGDSDFVQRMTDAQLLEVGEQAVTDDRLYTVFNELLREKIEELTGVNPEQEEDS